MSDLFRGRAATRLPMLAAVTATAFTLWAGTAFATPAIFTEPSQSGGDRAVAVVAMVNDVRENHGCDPVTVDHRLEDAAQEHSRDQAEQGEMSHVGSDGSEVGERVTDTGYRWSNVGENVAAGTTSADRVMEMWMESSGHRENIENCDYTGVGVAEVDGYWTQDFGTPRQPRAAG